MTVTVWTAAQVTDILAEAYYGAAKAGADMRRVADTLEALREPLCAATRPFYVWELLDDRVAEAYDNDTHATVAQVRAAYIEALVTQALQDSGSGWQALVTWYAEAAIAWRFEFCDRLMAGTPPEAGSASEHALLARAARFAQEERWYETYPMFCLLAEQPFLPLTHIARFVASLGLIELYHIFRPACARTHIDNALRIAPDDPYVLSSEADYLLTRRSVAESRLRCQRAIEIDPRHVVSYSILGDCALEENDLAAAEAWYRHAIKQRPGDTLAYGRLSRVYVRRAAEANVEDSLSELEQRVAAIELRVAYSFDVITANAYQERGELRRAEEWLGRAIARDSARIGAYVGLGYLFLEQSRFGDARIEFSRVVQMAPDALEGYLGLARLEEQQESWSEAGRWYEVCLQRCPHFEGFIRASIAWTEMKQGRFAAAEEEALRALRADPTTEGVLLQVERVAGDASAEESAARRMYERILALLGDSYTARFHHQIGLLLSRVGRHEEATASLIAAVNADPTKPLFYTTLAHEVRETRRWDTGRELLSSAPAAAQADPAFRTEMALVRNAEANELFARGDYSRAAARYEDAVRYTPTDAVLHSNLALAREYDTTVQDPVQRFEGVRAALAEAVRLDERNREYAARLAGAERLVDLSPFYADCGADRLPTVLPIVIEVASNLVKCVATEDFMGMGADMATRVKALRDRMLERYGVRLPGVHMRDNVALPDGAYVIMLREVPVAAGAIKPDQRFCTDLAEEIEQRRIPYERAERSAGVSGSWIGEPHCDAAAAAGLSVWHPMECAVRHLETVLERDLGELLGLDDVDAAMSQTCQELIPAIENDSGGLPRFTGILRALLAERMSVAGMRAICEHYLDARARGASDVDILEELRRLPQVRTTLPVGKRPIVLSAHFEARIADAIHRDGSLALLALPFEACADALQNLREQLGDPRDAVLLVETSEIRPFVRRLTMLEWPSVPVLARDEWSAMASTVPADLRMVRSMEAPSGQSA